MDRKSKKKIYLQLLLLGNIFLLLFFGVNIFREYNHNRQLNAHIKDLEDVARELEAKNLDILNMAKYLDSDEFLESEARLKFGMQKQGESVMLFDAPKEFSPTSFGDNNSSNIKKWFLYFFGKKG